MPNPTPDSRDIEREKVNKIIAGVCNARRNSDLRADDRDVIEAFTEALSTARREVEAETAVMRKFVNQLAAAPYGGDIDNEEVAGGYEAYRGSAARLLSSTTAGMDLLKRLEDAERKARALDLVEEMAWAEGVGNGLVIFPSTRVSDKSKKICLQALGDEDGTNLGDELCDPQPTLLEAIEYAAKEPK